MKRLVRQWGAGMVIGAFLAATTMPAIAAEIRVDASQGPSTLAEDALIPGDMIRLGFWREPEFSDEYPVDETGTVVLPFLGGRQVTGISSSDLKRQLIEDYREQLRNQAVQITLLRRVSVLGEVQKPGLYHADSTMSMGDVVALAGGATPVGKLNDIRIIRGGKEIVSDLRSDTGIKENVRSGDQIIVPKTGWFSRHGAQMLTMAISTLAFVAVGL